LSVPKTLKKNENSAKSSGIPLNQLHPIFSLIIACSLQTKKK